MRTFITILIGLLSCQIVVAQAESHPNILWIISEDVSPDLGCYGEMVIETPTPRRRGIDTI